MKKCQLIVVPLPAIGHIVSTIQFAKSLILLDSHLFISILIVKTPVMPYLNEYILSLTASHPNITLIHVPQPHSPPSSQLFHKSLEMFTCAFFDSHRSLVRNIIQHIQSSGSAPVVGFIVDLFCPTFIHLGDEFGIPSFIFLITSASFLNLMFYLPSHHQRVGKVFDLSDPPVSIPGFLNPVPVPVLPESVFNNNGGYEAYVRIAEAFRQVKGIIVNTFIELETYAIEIYKHGNYPKVYPVGPMLNLEGHPNPEMDRTEWEKIMKWLDDQTESSVVFLCFGSTGSFDVEQLREIALGLERSGHKFLWTIRFPSDENLENMEKNVKEMLPEGFLERIEGRGKISGWAPQVEVLRHKAIGGFVSHCGWNSMLESLWYGVPIAALPIFAEQQLNAYTFAKELGLAVELKLDYRRDSELKKEEVERAVRSVMDSANEVRKKVKNISEIAKKVQREGGSSFNALSEFIADVKGSH